MQIAFAFLAILWWIAVWGLSDLLTHEWTNEQKFWLYISLLIIVGVIVLLNPKIVERF